MAGRHSGEGGTLLHRRPVTPPFFPYGGCCELSTGSSANDKGGGRGDYGPLAIVSPSMRKTAGRTRETESTRESIVFKHLLHAQAK